MYSLLVAVRLAYASCLRGGWPTRCRCLLALLLLAPGAASATDYKFPGLMPVGCAGSAGTYTCGDLILLAGDTISLAAPLPAAIKVVGTLDTNNARINRSGAAADLALTVTGPLKLGSGSTITANISAASVDATSGNAVIVGNLVSTSGPVTLGIQTQLTGSINSVADVDTGRASTISGNIDASAGRVDVRHTSTVGGNITTTSSDILLGQSASVGGYLSATSGNVGLDYLASVAGNLATTSGTITIGQSATVGGNVAASPGNVVLGLSATVSGNLMTTSGSITIGQSATVRGNLGATSGSVALGYLANVAGSVSTTSGFITLDQSASVDGNLGATSGNVALGYRAKVNGNLVTTDGTIWLGQDSVVQACVQSSGSAGIRLDNQASAGTVCCGNLGNCGTQCVANNSNKPMPAICTAASANTLHHLEIRHASGSGLTCSPATVSVAACQDAACLQPYTNGVTGSLAASGAGMAVNWPDGASFAIPAGSSSGTLRLQQTTAGSSVLSTSSSTPSASSAATCNFGSPACTWTALDAGLLFDVPNHVSEVLQTVSVSAVKKADNSLACVPAFASTSKSVTFTCSYANPASGTLPVRVGGNALNSGNSPAAACDGGGRAVTLAFNASGVASTTVQYADVGQLSLLARYAGSAGSSEAGLLMSGSDGFIAAPASFAISAVSVAPIRAGSAFAASVSARNSAGATTPNFGRESPPEAATLSLAKRSPTGSGASAGVFTGSLGTFASGSATAANLVWSEVGSADLAATLTSASYLGSGLNASGSTGTGGAVGPFIPHHFDIAATPACSATFSYAAQPFAATVTARSATGSTTVNYDGSSATAPNQAGAVTLGEASALGLGSLAGGAISASAFSAGVASASPSYSFSSKTTLPQTLVLRASNGLTGSAGVSSAGFTEPSMPLRSGRLRLSNAFGSANASLQVPVVTEYWSGNSWVLNSADSCSTLAAGNLVLSNPRNAAGGNSSATSSAGAAVLANGSGLLSLAAPSPSGSSLSLDLAVNLGSSSTDQSCQASHPASVGAAKPWLRAQNGSCAASADRDPSARASFGLYSPESRKTVHARDIF